jgi:endonuclease G, mitochondrial
MVAPQNEYAFDLSAAIAASQRWAERQQHHARFEEAVRNGRYSELDTPDRLAKRANRLLTRFQKVDPQVVELMAEGFEEVLGQEIVAAEVTSKSVSDELLERIIGETRDFLFVEFLDQAIYASKAVGRITTQLGQGRVSYGTGFLVSPRLLLTNYHVLSSPKEAAQSVIEFDYQRDRLGRQSDVHKFTLAPSTFFLNDRELDFALVAVTPRGSGRLLQDYGWLALLKEEGKIVVGEPINIIQHPKGELKQVVIRANRLLDLPDRFAHYEADTEPGSSGSPVFNDQWEVIALHHSGIPKRNTKGELLGTDGKIWRDGDDPLRLAWVANEGIRVSRLVEFIAKARVQPAEVPLLKELLDAKAPPEQTLPTPVSDQLAQHGAIEMEVPVSEEPQPSSNSVTMTVPLHITFTLGDMPARAESLPVGLGRPSELLLEKIEPDPSDPKYERRPGYDPDFLGFAVPLPQLTNVAKPKAFALAGQSGEARFELKYHHFSVIFNQDRKLAFVAGVNYDPTAPVQYPRDKDGDKWFYDPRVFPEKELQAGETLYAKNPLDRGHLVRRADAGWGQTNEEAKLANDDTFHFTNCSPQHEITNQGQIKNAPPGLKLWGKLEDHVASQGKKNNRKLCIFNGPVFQKTDKTYRGVKIPKEFWKVVVFENDSEEPTVVAFVLTQAQLIQGLQEEFQVGEYKAVQVRIKDLEAKIDLDFGPFRNWDVLEKRGPEESFTGDGRDVVLDSLADVVL